MTLIAADVASSKVSLHFEQGGSKKLLYVQILILCGFIVSSDSDTLTL